MDIKVNKNDSLFGLLYCNDSFELLGQVGEDFVQLILTDPPYDLGISEQLELQNHFDRIAKGTTIVFSPPENQWIQPCNQYMFWIKPISTKNTSKNYSRFVEMIFIYQYANAVWNTDRHWSQYTNVATDLVDNSKLHPFRKPVSLLERLILNHTNEGDLVLDPFCGSGSTLEACIRTNRSFIGIEKNQEHINQILDRNKGFNLYAE